MIKEKIVTPLIGYLIPRKKKVIFCLIAILLSILALILGDQKYLADYSLYKYLDHNAVNIYFLFIISLLIFIVFSIVFIVIPGFVITEALTSTKGKAKNKYSIIVYLFSGFIFFCATTYILKLLHLSYIYYLISLLFLLFFIIYLFKINPDRKVFIWSHSKKELKNVYPVLPGLLLIIIFLRKILFIRMPYLDEQFYAQFILMWKDFKPFHNILYYMGSPLKHYTLGEYFVAQFSLLTNLDFRVIYFLVFPILSWTFVFVLLVKLIEEQAEINVKKIYLFFIPALFFIFVSFNWQALVHFLSRQPVNAVLFSILSIYFYKLFIKYKNYLYFALLSFSVLFILLSKALPALVFLCSLAVIELLRKNETIPKRAIHLIALIVFCYLFTNYFLEFSESRWKLTLNIELFHNFFKYKLFMRDYLMVDILKLWDSILHFKPDGITLIINYILMYNIQWIFLIICSIILLKEFKKNKGISNKNVILYLLTLNFAGNLICWLLFSFKERTGAAESYWHMASLYFITIFSIIIGALIIEKASINSYKFHKNKTILIIFAILFLSLGARNLFSFIKNPKIHYKIDKSFFEILKTVKRETSKNTLIVHNLYQDSLSVYISGISERAQFLSYVKFGGIMREKNIEERMSKLTQWFYSLLEKNEYKEFPFNINKEKLTFLVYSKQKPILNNHFDLMQNIDSYYLLKMK